MPVHDRDYTGQLPGVHVCKCVGVEQGVVVVVGVVVVLTVE